MPGYAAQKVVHKACPAQTFNLSRACAGANSSRASCLADRSYKQQLFAEARRPATGETFENAKISFKISVPTSPHAILMLRITSTITHYRLETNARLKDAFVVPWCPSNKQLLSICDKGCPSGFTSTQHHVLTCSLSFPTAHDSL